MTRNIYKSPYLEKMISLNKYFKYFLQKEDIKNAGKILYYMRVLIGKLSFKLYEFHQYINQKISTANQTELDHEYYQLGLLESFVYNSKILIEQLNTKLSNNIQTESQHEPFNKINLNVKKMVSKLKSQKSLYDKAKRCFLSKMDNINQTQKDKVIQKTEDFFDKSEDDVVLSSPEIIDMSSEQSEIIKESTKIPESLKMSSKRLESLDTSSELSDSLKNVSEQPEKTVTQSEVSGRLKPVSKQSDMLETSSEVSESVKTLPELPDDIKKNKVFWVKKSEKSETPDKEKKYVLFFYKKDDTDKNLMTKLLSLKTKNIEMVMLDKDKNSEYIKHYNVNKYPLLLLRKGTKVYKYHGEYDVNNIIKNMSELFGDPKETKISRIGDTKNPILSLYYANWCPHCVKFKPIWAELQKIVKREGLNLNFKDINAETEPDKIQKAGIQGYPTIKLYKGGVNVEYTGPRKLDSLLLFIKNKMA